MGKKLILWKNTGYISSSGVHQEKVGVKLQEEVNWKSPLWLAPNHKCPSWPPPFTLQSTGTSPFTSPDFSH